MSKPLCSKCRKPEKSKYSLTPGRKFICSICTVNSLLDTNDTVKTKVESK